jgi:hypothetical protein
MREADVGSQSADTIKLSFSSRPWRDPRRQNCNNAGERAPMALRLARDA